MAMGTRKQREKQEDIWIAHTELASAPGHPFYQRLNELPGAPATSGRVPGRNILNLVDIDLSAWRNLTLNRKFVAERENRMTLPHVAALRIVKSSSP